MTTSHAVNLSGMTFFEVKQLSKSLCGKTNEQLAEEIGMGHEHVARHFRAPDYNISPIMLPALCKAMGNTLQIEWQCMQAGGFFGNVDLARKEDASVDVQMSRVCKEAADVMGAWATAILDGTISHGEAVKIETELQHLIRKAEECRRALLVAKVSGKV